jgi:chromosome segregation ATPase
MRNLNIQVDNLFQFLPQDRVADFPKMSPQQLLENTEKCVGPPEMFEHHIQLKELIKQQAVLERKLNTMSERLQTEEQRNNRLQVENISEKRTLVHMLENLRQKCTWLVFDEMRSKLDQIKADKDTAVATSVMYEKRFEPMERIIFAAEAKEKELECRCGAVNAETSTKRTALEEMHESIEQTEGLIKDNIRNFEFKIKDEEQRQNEVHSLLQQISKLQNDFKGSTKESVT